MKFLLLSVSMLLAILGQFLLKKGVIKIKQKTNLAVTLSVGEKTKEELTNKAREEAVDKAKTKAEGLAKSAGISLGKIINISESGGFEPRPILMYDKTVGFGGAPETANITPGETEIEVSVTISYEIR